jgi:cytochrome c
MRHGKIALFAGAPIGPAQARATRGTREEAQALCEKAAALLKSEGLEKAVARFQAEDCGFVDRDLYVYLIDDKGLIVVHGAMPDLVGTCGLQIMDVTGFFLVKAFLAVEDSTWIDYKWPDLVDRKIKEKSSYVIRVGNHIVGVGYYK